MNQNNKYTGKKILAILAHPDDETFGMGGTLAYYAAHGADVKLICTTRGEAGDVAPAFLEKYDTVAELRAAELACAANKLGISEYHFLGYRDSGMTGAPSNEHPQALMNSQIPGCWPGRRELKRSSQTIGTGTFNRTGS